MFCPSIHPSSRNALEKAVMTAVKTGTLGLRKPIVCIFPGCCARAASVHAAAEPTITLMKLRRRIASPQKAPDHANCKHNYSSDFLPAEWGSGVSLHGSNPDPLMSALGQKRTVECVRAMSALPPKADIRRCNSHARFMPKGARA